MKEYKYHGETFHLDDSERCSIEVTYKKQTGYIGVSVNGAPGVYSWGAFGKSYVTKIGVYGEVAADSIEAGLPELCKHLVEKQTQLEDWENDKERLAREEQVRALHEERCGALHKFMDELPDAPGNP